MKNLSLYLLQLTKHHDTRGGINKKTISIRVSVYVLTYGDNAHRKFFHALHMHYSQFNVYALYALCSSVF